MPCREPEKKKLFDVSVCFFWVLFCFFCMCSTFPGTELDFLLKLTRQTKNNPMQEGNMGEKEGVKTGKESNSENERTMERLK